MVVVIKMRGLPYEASARDIREFYRGLEIKEDEIHLAPNENGKASGVAFAIFLNDDDARKAMYRDGRFLGKRYVNLFLSSIHEMQKILKEGVHERRKNPAVNSNGEPTTIPNNLKPRFNPELARSRKNERNGRSSRNQGENYRSDRSRSPLRSPKDERRRSVVGETHDDESFSASASSGLLESDVLESRRRFEQQDSLGLLASLSNHDLQELQRQLLATENRGYGDIDFKNALLDQASKVSLSRLKQEKMTESPWGFPQSFVPNHTGIVQEDIKRERIDDHSHTVAELFDQSHNMDPLRRSTDLGLGRIMVGNDLYHGNIVGGHDGDPTMIAAGGHNYINEKMGEVSEQILGQDKGLGGLAHPHIPNYGKMARGRDHNVNQRRLQERQHQSHERVNGRCEQDIGSRRVEREQNRNNKGEHRGRVHSHEREIGGRHHAGEHVKGTVGSDLKHEKLNKGHNHKEEARGSRHTNDHERAHERSDQRNGRAPVGQKSGHEKGARHYGRNDSHGKAAVGYIGNHVKKESKLDRDSERQKARHDHGYKEQKIDHNNRKILGGYDPGRTSGEHGSKSIGSNNGGRHDGLKIDDKNDESRGICINMVGLPYSCTEAEVAEFFKGLCIIRIHLRRNLSGSFVGKTNGQAFVVFRSLDDCMQAVERNHQYIRNRYVKVRKCPKEVMYEAIQQEANVFGKTSVGEIPSSGACVRKDLNHVLNSQPSSGIGSETGLGNELPSAFGYPTSHSGMVDNPIFGQEMIQPTVYGYTNDNSGHDSALSQLAQGANINVSDIKAGCVVGIRNLPSTVTADEILDFFYGFRVIPDSVRIHYLAPGRSSGDAIVTFMDGNEARIATEQLNNKPVGRRNVQLFPV